MGARAAVAGAFGLMFASLAGPADAGRIVAYPTDYPAGAVLISQSAKRLYLIVDAQTAIAYPVAVARRGKEWSGPARIVGKFVEPAWSPPDSVKRDHPELPDVIRGGSPSNPMGGGRSRSTATRSRFTARRQRCAAQSALRRRTAASAC